MLFVLQSCAFISDADHAAHLDPDHDGVGFGQDCDDDDPDVGRAPAWHPDGDGDGFGGSDGVTGCTAPAGHISDATDCDDDDATVHPGAEESDCTDPIDYNCDGSAGADDADADGWIACEDCDDGDAAKSPDATETCDGADENCDGKIDEDAGTLWYADADADTFGEVATSIVACAVPTDFVADGSDCDDTDAGVHPGAVETCDERDEDCDDVIDEGAGDTWYADADTDGYGDASATTVACAAPAGYLADSNDCDDGDVAVHPGADEQCDSRDNDCDGETDEDAGTDWYYDGDRDSYGDRTVVPVVACSAPADYSPNATDCDDADANVNPDAVETCDGVDQDCDGAIDVGAIDADVWYADTDNDSFGDASEPVAACDAPGGYVADATDCDDADSDSHPGGVEVCDAADADEDCDGDADDADDAVSGTSTWHRDADSDGYGGGTTVVRCDAPAGYVADSTDCDDTDAAVSPSEIEVCDAADTDEDCDGVADDAAATGRTTFYVDADGDNYGTTASAAYCDRPAGYASVNTDCNDANSAIHPGASEVCDAANTDEDCDLAADNADSSAAAAGKTSWYLDSDLDGYGSTTTASYCDLPAGYASVAGDCDDADASSNPGEVEVCNDGADNDCDGSAGSCGVTGALSLAGADARIAGYNFSDQAGYRVGGVDDLTGDGLPDILVGVPFLDGAGSESGGVYVVSGATRGNVNVTSVDQGLLYGEAANDYAGLAMAAGDFDADGTADLLIGAYANDRNGTTAGAAFLVLGPISGNASLATADAILVGESASDQAGYVVAIANLDGGFDDEPIIGAPEDDEIGSNSGAVYFFDHLPSGEVDLATADGKLRGGAAGDKAGYALASVGDFDGDGSDDTLIGAPLNDTVASNAGIAYLESGTFYGVTTLTSAAEAIFRGVSASDNAGIDLAGLGDVNGDGLTDVVVGANGGVGHAYIVLGGTTGTTSLSAASLLVVGAGGWGERCVGGGGDIGGDGSPDLLVGAYGSGTGGTTYLFAGGTTGTVAVADADATITGESASDYAGISVGTAGDVDGDSFDDLLIGASGYDGRASATGAVYLVLGGGL